MAAHVQGRVASTTDSERISGREIETIVEEFSGEPGPAQDGSSSASADAVVTPRTKSSLAKKLAKSLGFHSHSKDSTSESSVAKTPGFKQKEQQQSPESKVIPERGVHFTDSASSGAEVAADASSAALASSPRATSNTSSADKPSALTSAGAGKFVSPFQAAQHQPSGTESSAFYSPTSSFNSVGSGRMSKAMSASLEDEGSQMRKSRLAPGNPQSYSGDLEQIKPRLNLLQQAFEDDRTASGLLSGKSRRSSAVSLKDMDGENSAAILCSKSPAHHQQTLSPFQPSCSAMSAFSQHMPFKGMQAMPCMLTHAAQQICWTINNTLHLSNDAGDSVRCLEQSVCEQALCAGASDTDKDLNPVARANSENPWGPKRSVGSFTSGVSGRARGDQSPRLRGAYAEIQIKVRRMSHSDAALTDQHCSLIPPSL